MVSLKFLEISFFIIKINDKRSVGQKSLKKHILSTFLKILNKLKILSCRKLNSLQNSVFIFF